MFEPGVPFDAAFEIPPSQHAEGVVSDGVPRICWIVALTFSALFVFML